jgi:cysteinyl-tRNA synthetase
MLRLSAEKMSKSVGNVERLRDALDRAGPETLCAFFASASYRNPIDYDDDALDQARRSNERFREALRNARRYAVAGAGGGDEEIAAAGTAAGAANKMDWTRWRHSKS